ncbi:MAG TPA: MarR family winged helix-turn-helix transcriptional regulator [bacterium]|jgi:DNA-binding MarR family transcriptional regulator|nr:MarR family winged helix-turn-helix transcriptional regulator [bacterium]
MPEIFRHFQGFRKALASAFKQSCRSINLDMRQAAVLKALADLGSSSAVDLCQATLLDPATVNRTVAQSVVRGWIKQVKDPEDRRCCRLSLTALGAEQARLVLRQYRLLERKTFRPFSVEERRRFSRDLERLTSYLKAS